MDEHFELEVIEHFKHMAYTAMCDASMAHELIFKDKESVAIAYLNSAIANFSALKALYYAKYDLFARPEFDKVFIKFDVFRREMLNNIRTNHSHQWTDIEFRNFKDAFDRSGIAK